MLEPGDCDICSHCLPLTLIQAAEFRHSGADEQHLPMRNPYEGQISMLCCQESVLLDGISHAGRHQSWSGCICLYKPLSGSVSSGQPQLYRVTLCLRKLVYTYQYTFSITISAKIASAHQKAHKGMAKPYNYTTPYLQ